MGDLQLRATISSEIILRLDEAMDYRVHTEDERCLRASMKVNLLGIAALQRSLWRQKSRVQWVKEGDANTRFFQLKASARRRKNYIPQLLHDGVPVADEEAKMEIIWKKIYGLIGHSSPRSDRLKFQELGIEPLDLHELDAPFAESEVLGAINDLAPEKAPGPDGYTGLFFRKCWAIIKHDVMAAINQVDALACSKLNILNDATMVLIPKNRMRLLLKISGPFA